LQRDLQRRSACEPPGSISRGVTFEKLTEKECLAAKWVGPRIFGKQVAEFVSECRSATGFEKNHWGARLDFGLQGPEDAGQVALSIIQHPEIVQGAATAQLSR